MPAPKVKVVFDRISRDHNPPVLVAEAPDIETLGYAILECARPRVMSADVEIALKFDPETLTGNGFVLVGGFRNAGDFTVTPAPPVEEH